MKMFQAALVGFLLALSEALPGPAIYRSPGILRSAPSASKDGCNPLTPLGSLARGPSDGSSARPILYRDALAQKSMSEVKKDAKNSSHSQYTTRNGSESLIFVPPPKGGSVVWKGPSTDETSPRSSSLVYNAPVRLRTPDSLKPSWHGSESLRYIPPKSETSLLWQPPKFKGTRLGKVLPSKYHTRAGSESLVFDLPQTTGAVVWNKGSALPTPTPKSEDSNPKSGLIPDDSERTSPEEPPESVLYRSNQTDAIFTRTVSGDEEKSQIQDDSSGSNFTPPSTPSPHENVRSRVPSGSASSSYIRKGASESLLYNPPRRPSSVAWKGLATFNRKAPSSAYQSKGPSESLNFIPPNQADAVLWTSRVPRVHPPPEGRPQGSVSRRVDAGFLPNSPPVVREYSTVEEDKPEHIDAVNGAVSKDVDASVDEAKDDTLQVEDREVELTDIPQAQAVVEPETEVSFHNVEPFEVVEKAKQQEPFEYTASKVEDNKPLMDDSNKDEPVAKTEAEVPPPKAKPAPKKDSKKTKQQKRHKHVASQNKKDDLAANLPEAVAATEVELPREEVKPAPKKDGKKKKKKKSVKDVANVKEEQDEPPPVDQKGRSVREKNVEVPLPKAKPAPEKDFLKPNKHEKSNKKVASTRKKEDPVAKTPTSHVDVETSLETKAPSQETKSVSGDDASRKPMETSPNPVASFQKEIIPTIEEPEDTPETNVPESSPDMKAKVESPKVDTSLNAGTKEALPKKDAAHVDESADAQEQPRDQAVSSKIGHQKPPETEPVLSPYNVAAGLFDHVEPEPEEPLVPSATWIELLSKDTSEEDQPKDPPADDEPTMTWDEVMDIFEG